MEKCTAKQNSSDEVQKCYKLCIVVIYITIDVMKTRMKPFFSTITLNLGGEMGFKLCHSHVFRKKFKAYKINI